MEVALRQLASFNTHGIIIRTALDSTAIQHFVSIRALLMESAVKTVSFAGFEKALNEITVHFDPKLVDKGGFKLIIAATRRLEPLSPVQVQGIITALNRIIHLTIQAGVSSSVPAVSNNIILPSSSLAPSNSNSTTSSGSSSRTNRYSTTISPPRNLIKSSEQAVATKNLSVSSNPPKRKRKNETEEINLGKIARVVDKPIVSSSSNAGEVSAGIRESRPSKRSIIKAQLEEAIESKEIGNKGKDSVSLENMSPYERPSDSYRNSEFEELIKEAILSTPNRCMTSAEAFEFIVAKWPRYARSENSALKDVRFCLSLSGQFKKVHKVRGSRGYYWGIRRVGGKGERLEKRIKSKSFGRNSSVPIQSNESNPSEPSSNPSHHSQPIETKPKSWRKLLAEAFSSAPKKRMTVIECAEWLMGRYEYFAQQELTRVKAFVSSACSPGNGVINSNIQSSSGFNYYYIQRNPSRNSESESESEDEDESESAVSEIENGRRSKDLEMSDAELSEAESASDESIEDGSSGEREVEMDIPTQTKNKKTQSSSTRPIPSVKSQISPNPTSISSNSRSGTRPSLPATQAGSRIPTSSSLMAATSTLSAQRLDSIVSKSSSSQEESSRDKMEGNEKLKVSKREKETEEVAVAETRKESVVVKARIAMSFDW